MIKFSTIKRFLPLIIFICYSCSYRLKLMNSLGESRSNSIESGFNLQIVCDDFDCNNKNKKVWVNMGFDYIRNTNLVNVAYLRSRLSCLGCHKKIRDNCVLDYAFKSCEYLYSPVYTEGSESLSGSVGVKPIHFNEPNGFGCLSVCVKKLKTKFNNVKDGLNVKVTCKNTNCKKYMTIFFLHLGVQAKYYNIFYTLSMNKCSKCSKSLKALGTYTFKNCSYVVKELISEGFEIERKGYAIDNPSMLTIENIVENLEIGINSIEKYSIKRNYPSPKFCIYTSEVDKNFANMCHNSSITFISNAISYLDMLNENDSKSTAPYIEYFGTYNKGRFEKVKIGFKLIKELLEYSNIVYKFKESKNSIIANIETSKNCNHFEKIINLCSGFFEYRKLYNKSKANILGACSIIHEFSHVAFDTEDDCYGYSDCLNLGKVKPKLAIKNADSYDYFTQYIIENKCYPSI